MLMLVGILLVVLMAGLLLLLLWEERRDLPQGAAQAVLTDAWLSDDRRQHPRRLLHVSVVYTVTMPDGRETRLTGHTANLSLGGMCLRTVEHLPTGATLRFEVRPPRNLPLIRGTGQVRWLKEQPMLDSKRTFDAGIQFLQLVDSGQQRLQALLEEHTASPHSTGDPDGHS